MQDHRLMTPRQRALRWAVLAWTLPVLGSCDGRDPTGVRELRVVISSPAQNATIPDTLLTFRGFVEAPGGVESAVWWLLQGTAPGHEGTAAAETRVPFEITVSAKPGENVFGVNMEGTDSDGTHRQYTATVTVTVYKKPTLKAVHGIAPELFQRSLVVEVEIDGLPSYWWANLALDPGTSAERVINNGAGTSQPLYIQFLSGGRARLFFPDTIAPGTHKLEVRLYDQNGLADVHAAQFVISVAGLRYRLDTLPSLGAGTRALALNENGDVAGRAFDPASARDRAVAWRGGALDVLDTAVSVATAIDIQGRVAGISGSCGVIWQGGTTTTLRNASGQCASVIADMNDAGTVLAAFSSSWALVRGTSVTPIPLDGGRDLNDSDQAVGWVIYTNGGTRASAYGLTLAVPAPFPQPSPHYSEDAMRVNNRGHALIENGGGPSFLDDRSRIKQAISRGVGDVILLAPFFGIPSASGTLVDLTESGIVLAFDPRTNTGYVYDGARTWRVALEPTPWILEGLSAMNDAGRIIGQARLGASTVSRAVVLTPVP
jgi:hypothetical protein